MKRARLIKREEVIERQQIETAASEAVQSTSPESSTPQPSVVKLTVDAVRKWANERQSNKSVKPREAFDALFAQPRMSE
ncbi:MAG: hypothetical protein JMDDDDMK_00200 [Acidobacteria bacterium]|nr:hypothetical protein [Acidobacteriota bacterium]